MGYFFISAILTHFSWTVKMSETDAACSLETLRRIMDPLRVTFWMYLWNTSIIPPEGGRRDESAGCGQWWAHGRGPTFWFKSLYNELEANVSSCDNEQHHNPLLRGQESLNACISYLKYTFNILFFFHPQMSIVTIETKGNIYKWRAWWLVSNEQLLRVKS